MNQTRSRKRKGATKTDKGGKDSKDGSGGDYTVYNWMKKGHSSNGENGSICEFERNHMPSVILLISRNDLE